MKVTVTGAAGRLGRHACTTLLEKGHQVVGLDKSIPRDAAWPGHAIELTNREACYQALAGTEALVHLGNIPNQCKGDAQTVFNTNVAINMNVFQAAWELGVGKIVFASSIQAIFNERENPFEKPQTPIPWLPVDGAVPPLPQNPYSLSKVIGEVQLEYFSRMGGIEAVAIRFPALYRRRHFRQFSYPHPFSPQAFAMLSMSDAAQLIAACIAAPLPGFRVYLPSSEELVNDAGGVAEVLERYYPATPRKKPVETLVDISKITRETGWTPKGSWGAERTAVR